MEEQAKRNFLVDLGFTISVGAIVYIAVKFLLSYLLPFVIASIVAWLVQKPAEYIARRIKIKKGICAALLSVVFYIAVIMVIFLILYNFTFAAKGLLTDLPDYLQILEKVMIKFQNGFNTVLNGISNKLAVETDNITKNMLTDITHKLTEFLSGLATGLAGGIPSFLFSSIVTLVAGCYIAKDFERLSRFLNEFLGKRIYCNIIKIKEIFVHSVFKLIKGYFILMLITFVELLFAFWVLDTKYPIALALLISFIDLLPVLGIGTVLIPWSIIEFVLMNGKMGIMILLIYLTITVVRNFLEPRIIGKQIGINPLFTLIAMFAGVKIFGFAGIFIAPIVFIVSIKYYKNELENEKLADIKKV